MFNANCLVRFFFASFPEKAGNIWKLFYNFALKIHLRDLSSPMTCREKLNKANAAKRMADFLGHSKDLITLSLSLRRSPTRGVVTSFILRAGCPRQYTAFPGTNQEKSACFCPPSGRLRRGRGRGPVSAFAAALPSLIGEGPGGGSETP